MTLLPLEITSLPGPAQKIVAADAPARLKQMAAKGIVPGLKPEALVAVLALLASDADAAIAAEAQATLGKLPPPLMQGALGADLHPWVIDVMAGSYIGEREVLAKLIAMPRVSVDTVERLAENGTEPVTELVATNEQRLLENPQIIAALYLNKHTRMSTADRIVELAQRNGVEVKGIPAWREVATAIQNELIVEASDEPLPDDVLFYEQDQLAAELEGALDNAFVTDAEGKEQVDEKLRPVSQRLAEMTISQKIRRAMLGSREERMILVREQNRVVAEAAIKSPLMQEGEVAQIARNRNVPDVVLRIIASTPEWLKSYQIKRNLVENSKCPIALASALIPQLREADLKKIANDKNVSSAIQMAAKRHLTRRDH